MTTDALPQAGDALKSILRSLRTCKGQVEGVIGMIENARDPVDVSNQILAAQAMLKRANKLILAQHIDKITRAAINDPAKNEGCAEEVTALLDKLLHQP